MKEPQEGARKFELFVPWYNGGKRLLGTTFFREEDDKVFVGTEILGEPENFWLLISDNPHLDNTHPNLYCRFKSCAHLGGGDWVLLSEEIPDGI